MLSFPQMLEVFTVEVFCQLTLALGTALIRGHLTSSKVILLHLRSGCLIGGHLILKWYPTSGA